MNHKATGGYPQAVDAPAGDTAPAWTNRSDNLPVSEVFGPVWQGEGPHSGRVCAFVRLGHCNLSCSWCDTPFTWDDSRYDLVFEDLSGAQIVDRLPNVDMVVLSGGEPMMHQHRPAMAELLASNYEWHIETNGTITPNEVMLEGIHHFTVSPKIITDDPASKRLKGRPLAVFADLARAGLAIFKFVVDSPRAVAEAADLATFYDVPDAQVWIMPEGVTAEAVLDGARKIADMTAANGFNLTLRQQVLMYGQERAR